MDGWYVRRFDLTLKYRPYFKERYQLAERYWRGNAFVAGALDRTEGQVLVGIHIRRGDYRTWAGGAFFFEDAVYKNYMDRIALLLSEQGKSTKFIIFSNEPIGFTEGKDLLLSHEPWYLDQFLMSHCDFLIGPPSTFTKWASYIGEVPYLHIAGQEARFSLSDFTVSDGSNNA